MMKGSDSIQRAESQPLNDTGQQGSRPQANGRVELKQALGLLDGVAIIVGIIIGAGIFISPKGVLLQAGSPGLALIIWVMSGLLSLIGAICYAELGTMIPKSGADYAYIMASFGPLPAFLFLWVVLIIIVPTGNAILSITFANYVLQPFYPGCDPPDIPVRLMAAAVISLLTAINCYNVKWGARVQGVFTVTKLIALATIIIAGLVAFCTGKSDNLADPWEGTTTDPGKIALAFYSGLFSFAGWNYLNFVTEELKEPYKNLPRAIWISLPLVTFIYALANAAYFVVLTKAEILDSNAVAVTFGDQILGVMSWIMPAFVACSTFGALNCAIFAPSRLVFVAAREGHLPKALAIVNVETFTPIPALTFLGLLSIFMLLIKDIYVLINYLCFVEALAFFLSVAGLLWLRKKDPKLERPIKVNLIFPILFILVSLFLICVPIVTSPASEIGVAILVIASGVPVYLIFIVWKNKPRWMTRISYCNCEKEEVELEDETGSLLHNSHPVPVVLAPTSRFNPNSDSPQGSKNGYQKL